MHIPKIIPFFCLLGLISLFIHVQANAGLKDQLDQSDTSKTTKRKNDDNTHQNKSKKKKVDDSKETKPRNDSKQTPKSTPAPALLTKAITPPQTINNPESEMKVSFLKGTDDHFKAYSKYIKKAETEIIIASWNVNYIPELIFSSLMEAKKRGIHISFVVNSVKRKATLDYFENDEEKETTFRLVETKSHAKFLFVDQKYLILGSFNSLGESQEETEDASYALEGSIPQLWPFYMSLYETYTSLGEDLGGIFDGIAMISKARSPGPRPLLERNFKDGSRIFLLRTLKEHEDFLKLATPYNGKVTIYSPFSTKDNTLKRLKTLESILPNNTEVHLKVLKQFENGLTRLLSSLPNLKSHAHIDVATSHKKIIALGDETLCVGSLNWLSAAQDEKDPYKNIELSIVLQGPKAAEVIKSYYMH